MALDVYQARVKLFHAALGEAIAQWSWLETHLCTTFHWSIGATCWPASAAAFFSIGNFRSKLDATNAAISHGFVAERSSVLKDEWQNLKKKIKSASEKRNRLAHNQVTMPIYEDFGPVPLLVKNLFDPKSGGVDEALKSGVPQFEIEAFTKEFQNLGGELSNFNQQIIQLSTTYQL